MMTIFRHVNMLEAVSLQIPGRVRRHHYEVPLSDVLLSKQMMKKRLPGTSGD